jgi:hypothetical protein
VQLLEDFMSEDILSLNGTDVFLFPAKMINQVCCRMGMHLDDDA